MNGKIDEKGDLWIERAGKMRGQGCPYSNGLSMCGDWCSLFGEPEMVTDDGPTELALCHQVWYFTNFTDERWQS